MREHYYGVIMAGGGGTRLWPLSRRGRPKQLIKFSDEQSLFQMAVNRLEDVFPPDRILIVTSAALAAKLKPQCPIIPRKNYIIEPEPRGTAPAIGLSAAVIKARDDHPETTMAVLTADHVIQNVPYFRNLLDASYALAESGFLVTLGIKPTFPSTGYGYIKSGDWVGVFQGINAYKVVKFVEKPDEIKARSLIQTGKHDWNSGMFIWRVDRILEEFRHHMPILAEGLDNISGSWKVENRQNVINFVWETLEPQTIDYGIMEKADKVVVIPTTNLGWYDVGSWDSLFDVLPTDSDGNIIVGSTHMGLGTHHTLIYTENTNKLIVTIGVQNLIVVDTGDAILICPRNEAQKVKQVIELLEKSGKQDYL
jgi:mannose-1-phosphate guanylyltransferase